jgi:hypothetical protein
VLCLALKGGLGGDTQNGFYLKKSEVCPSRGVLAFMRSSSCMQVDIYQELSSAHNERCLFTQACIDAQRLFACTWCRGAERRE